MAENKVIDTFFGNDEYPVVWENEEEKKLMWWYDDLHCPNPLSPMYFSCGGWWGPTCAYFYKRFGYVGGCDWVGKLINGYLYTAVVPPKTAPDLVDGHLAYYGGVMPVYAETFLDKWENEYIPELISMADKMIDFDFENATIPEAMIHLEDCLDWQERAFRIHWILNYAQAQASGEFQAIYEEAVGPVDEDYSLITVSPDDRNWDSLRDAWKIKEEICADAAMKAFWEGNTAADIMANLEAQPGGAAIKEKIVAYVDEYGWKPLWTHEYTGKIWKEDPTPVYEALKNYVITDYDYPKQIAANNDSQKAAIERARARITDEELRPEFERLLALDLKMLPLTPNHHFYIDQSIYAHMRIMFLGIGDMLVKAGKLDDREDIFMLTYDELRAGACSDLDLKSRAAKARAAMEEAAKKPPRYWYGTVDHWSLYEEIYKQLLWGYPDVYFKSKELEEAVDQGNTIKAISGSAGVVEGPARVVKSPAEFDQLQPEDIMVCQMTNPGWIIAFSKIAGLVTDTGGALSHPAVVSREFGIPCVVGCVNATYRIKTGDIIRVNGDEGTVEILEQK